MRDLYIIGAGGFGRETAWLAERINRAEKTWNIAGFIDDDPALSGAEVDGYKVVGSVDDLGKIKQAWAVCAVGNVRNRKKIIERLPSVNFATLIDPDVKISGRVSVGEGAIVCAGNIITVDVRIGRHCIINLDCTVGHDAEISDFVTLYPGVNVSGGTVIGGCVEMGTGSQVIQGIRISPGSVVGAGAVVVKDISEAGTYVGVPARRMKQ